MTYDAHVNFGYANVAAAPTPATTGTSLTLQAGQASGLPAAPFNAVVGPVPSLLAPRLLASNAEIVRVTAIVGDVLTIARHQEGSSVRTILAGDQFAAAITAKSLTDIEAAVAVGDAIVSVNGHTGVVSLAAADVGADASGAASAAQAAAIAVSAQRASNLSDVASAGTSRFNLHDPVLTPAAVVATSNSAISGLLTIDGYTLLAGDHVLLTAQSTGAQNGPWVAASGAWTRPATYPTAGSIGGPTGGTRTIDIINGTLGAGGRWLLKTNVAITIDTSSTTWVLQSPPSVVSDSRGTTEGDLLAYDADESAFIRKGVGADGTVLTADSTQDGGVKWTAAAASTLTVVAGGSLGATPALNMASQTNTTAVLLTGTLTANATLTITNLTAGAFVGIELTQDATGYRSFSITVGGSTVYIPVLQNPGTYTVLQCYYDGTDLYVKGI